MIQYFNLNFNQHLRETFQILAAYVRSTMRVAKFQRLQFREHEESSRLLHKAGSSLTVYDCCRENRC